MNTQYLAYWLDGDGTEHLMDPDLPLSNAKITREMNGIGRLTASLPPEYGRLTAFAYRPVIQEWATAIYVEIDGDSFDGFLVAETTDDNDKLLIDAVGFTGYGEDQPWPDKGYSFNAGNVLTSTVIRTIWKHVQQLTGSNIGLDLDLDGEGLSLRDDPGGWPRIGNPIQDNLPSPNWPGSAPSPRAGKQPKAPKYPSSSSKSARKKYDKDRKKYDSGLKTWRKKNEADRKRKQEWESKKRDYDQAVKKRDRMIEDAKVKLNHWSTTDLLSTFQGLASEVGFSYRVDHSRSGNTVSHTLVCRPGRLGVRRHGIAFTEGENVYSVPKVTRAGEDKVTSAMILGAGDGSSTRWRQTSRPAGGSHGLRRARVFTDKSLTRDTQLAARSQEVLEIYSDPIEIDEFTIIDHGLAPIRTFDVGDEIFLRTFARRAGNLERWVTITSITLQPEKNSVQVKVIPAD